MLRDERAERAWRRAVVVGLCLAWGTAWPSQAQGEEPVAEPTTPPLEVTAIPDPNDEVVVLSNGVPTTEVRIRRPEVRTYQDLHRIGEWPDPASIPTRGMSSEAVDVIYHGTRDFGEPSGITVRGVVGAPSSQSIVIHRFGAPPDDSRIRYHGGFR